MKDINNLTDTKESSLNATPFQTALNMESELVPQTKYGEQQDTHGKHILYLFIKVNLTRKWQPYDVLWIFQQRLTTLYLFVLFVLSK